MDEAPGVADRELILTGVLVCSTARPARTCRESSMNSGWSFRRKYFVGDHHARRPIVDKRNAFAFCCDPLTELYMSETGPLWRGEPSWRANIELRAKTAKRPSDCKIGIPVWRFGREGA